MWDASSAGGSYWYNLEMKEALKTVKENFKDSTP